MRARRLKLSRPWADLVLHVLAHVQSLSRFPAGLWDPAYAAFVAGAAGPACERALGQDVDVLGRAIGSHEQLARLHLLACLFETPEQALASAAMDLAQLTAQQVAEPRVLAALAECGPVAEVLRAAAMLEVDAWRSLPDAAFPETETSDAFDAMRGLAPRLGDFRLCVSRALGLRGRVLAGEIWLGIPGVPGGPTTEHVAWQAAHEACVAEVAERARAVLGEREVEHVALVLLSERARGAQRASAHRSWLSTMTGLPPLTEHALTPPAREILQRLR